MSKKILLCLAPGFEEIEAVASVDVMRRGGLDVTVAGVGGRLIKGGHDITVEADAIVDDMNSDDFDMIVLPGGLGGVEVLSENEKVQSLIREMSEKDKHIAAICAAALALDKAGVLEGKFTCYPGVVDEVKSGSHVDSRIVVNGKMITSQGPGTAICFALEIVKQMAGMKIYEQVKEKMLAAEC